MTGSYQKFAFTHKEKTTGGQIGHGEVSFSHLAPSLFVAIRNIELHSHSGVGSRRINLKDLIGNFTKRGFVIYSSDGTKKYQATISSVTGDWVLTEI